MTLEDDGSGGREGGFDDGPSLGLRLIRQRLELLGGRLQAGPLEDGGFALRGHIPLRPAAVGRSGSPASPAATGG